MAIKAEELCSRLGYHFQDPTLLREALTHKSCPFDDDGRPLPSNERLEFLGDSVLGLVVSELLMERFPDLDEGGLSKIRASLVNEAGLNRMALKVGLGEFLILGKGEDLTGGRDKPSLLSDAMEAVFAGIYLDSRSSEGLQAIRQVIRKLMEHQLPETPDDFVSRDFKSELQEKTQQSLNKPATYFLLEETGPDHQKEFVMSVMIDECELGRGNGPSKKLAGQAAARKALEYLREHPEVLQSSKS